MADTKAVATQAGAALLEKVVIGGDLKDLSPAERVAYYRQVCESIGLNPLTKPFDYITLNGKLTLYARKDATDQLRKRDGVSIVPPLTTQIINDTYIVTAIASVDGRTDISTGAVSIKNKAGDDLANAMLKAETKAKRRVTLSICGLGMLDETEVADVATPQLVTVAETGEIVQASGNGHAPAGITFPGAMGTATPSDFSGEDKPFTEAVADDKMRKRFWGWAAGLKANTNDVHTALKCESLLDYKGTVGEAKAAIIAFVRATDPKAVEEVAA
jgi:hypothetical protein